MSFIRPEAAAALRTWGLPAAFGVLGIVLIWHGWGMTMRGALVGIVFIALGAFCCLALFGAAERALAGWRGRHGGPGLVTIEEGRISYFAPFGGGIIAIDALTRVEIVTTDRGPSDGDLFWRLSDMAGQAIAIPGGAQGAESLPDVLGVLPGFDHLAVLRAMGSTGPARFAIWRSAGDRGPHPGPHPDPRPPGVPR